MTAALTHNAPPRVIVDHISSHGPEVTHVRGILLVKSLENLRNAGLLERQQELLTPALREQLEFAIAASWVPVDIAEQHYAACDRLALSDEAIDKLGERMADSMGTTVMSSLLKTTRQAGIDAIWTALKQNDRIWDRMYLGGGVSVLQTGPKDIVLEYQGISLAQSNHFRRGLRAYWLRLGQMMTKTVYVKPIRPREPHPHRMAFAGSWV